MSAVVDPVRRRAWRQTLGISVAAVAIFAIVRALPLAGGSLHYTDFHGATGGFLEFCAPGSPQFAPVDRVRSPVSLQLETVGELLRGHDARVRARLVTAGEKPVAAADLLVVHTEKLHLLIVDESLSDYQHVHPRPGDEAGSYWFEFSPQCAGKYRVFADFTPRATGRALYAGATLDVAGDALAATTVDKTERRVAVIAGLELRLAAERQPLRINEDNTLTLVIARTDGGAVVLDEIMGAPAHLVAFDARVSGFAHLHPLPVNDAATVAAGRQLSFRLNLSDPGFYRLWAQVKVDGREVFAPFGIQAEP